MGGGILPVAFINNHPYFLFSREALIAKEDPGKWSDFGGSKEGKESHRETAIREGWEESNGFLGTKTNVKNLVKNSLIASIQGRGYVTFIVNVKYNKNIEQAFKDDFKEMYKNNPKLVKAHNGLYEKDRVKWIPLRDLKRKRHTFRRWYRYMVDQIIKEFS
tara:strand:+ start:807 stop:1289 length:483 start_codon:yes stop_codon:yes gene_type:complete